MQAAAFCFAGLWESETDLLTMPGMNYRSTRARGWLYRKKS